jgi:uncharacterized protein HemY
MTPSEWRRAQAKLRVERALAQIQLAQDCLSRASSELSALHYGHPAQKRVSKLRDRVHAEWYRTTELRQHPRVELDREPTPADLWEPPK